MWTVILLPTVLEMARGWRALDDDATISLRSYQVLSLHPPLLGQFSTVSYGTGHLLFDPGPLLYWLLAIPVHIDPAQGGLWGGALCCGWRSQPRSRPCGRRAAGWGARWWHSVQWTWRGFCLMSSPTPCGIRISAYCS